MKCKICKAPAAVALKSHNAAFCPDCYKNFFARQVARGIESQKLFSRDERILVALSGGKDSLALMLELSRQGYNVTGLHIDLAIPSSSAAARGMVERFCARHGLRLLIRDMAAEGLPSRRSRSACTARSVRPAARSNVIFSIRWLWTKALTPWPPDTTWMTRWPVCSATPCVGTRLTFRIRGPCCPASTALPARSSRSGDSRNLKPPITPF